MTAADAPELTTRDCKDWALAYADLAAKLAAAEERAHYIEALERALRAIQRAHDANSSDSAALAQIHRIVCAALAQTGEPTG